MVNLKKSKIVLDINAPLTYVIDKSSLQFKASNSLQFTYGEDLCLSELYNDPVLNQSWGDIGHHEINLSSESDFSEMRNSVSELIRTIITKQYPHKSLRGFTLEKYHHFVDVSEHALIIEKTRRVSPEDLTFDVAKVISTMRKQTGLKLSFINPVLKSAQWLIIRINPPGSKGYNPPHKDIYQIFDAGYGIPKMINCWIPICGVNHTSGLPVASGSHLVNENQIHRTKAGVRFENQLYSVNCVKTWGGRNDLQTMAPAIGKMLLFSSHLVHGLGINNNEADTRISFEFRMFAD